MMNAAIALVLALSPAALDEDEDTGVLESQVRTLVQRLSSDGVAGQVKQAAATPAGREALKEALEACVLWKTRPFEDEGSGFYESWFFAVDANGVLTLRPERKADLERLAARRDEMLKLWDHFNQRADALVRDLDDTADLNRSVLAAWRSPEDRLARFRQLARDLFDAEETGPSQGLDEWFDVLQRERFESRDGKLHAKSVRQGEDDDDDEGENRQVTPKSVDRAREHRVREFREARSGFQDIVERCEDPAVHEVFDAPVLTVLLEEHRESVRESLIRAAHETALGEFSRRYLAGTGDSAAWRADRQAKADEILARAKEIALEEEAEEREEADEKKAAAGATVVEEKVQE